MLKTYESKFNLFSCLQKITVIIFYFQIIILLLALISNINEFQELNNISNGLYENDLQKTSLQNKIFLELKKNTFTVLGSTVFSLIIFLSWFYFAILNIRKLCARNINFFSDGSFLSFFPILISLNSYEAMIDLWKTSNNPQNWQNEITPTSLSYWWILKIVNDILILFSISSYNSPNSTFNDMLLVNLVNIFLVFIEIVMFIILITFVKEITSKQLALRQ